MCRDCFALCSVARPNNPCEQCCQTLAFLTTILSPNPRLSDYHPAACMSVYPTSIKPQTLSYIFVFLSEEPFSYSLCQPHSVWSLWVHSLYFPITLFFCSLLCQAEIILFSKPEPEPKTNVSIGKV